MILEGFLAVMLNDTLTMDGVVGIDEEGDILIDEDFLDSYFILMDLIEMLDAGDIHLEFLSDNAGKRESFHKLLTNYVYTT